VADSGPTSGSSPPQGHVVPWAKVSPLTSGGTPGPQITKVPPVVPPRAWATFSSGVHEERLDSPFPYKPQHATVEIYAELSSPVAPSAPLESELK
jgi:hypothetical protein